MSRHPDPWLRDRNERLTDELGPFGVAWTLSKKAGEAYCQACRSAVGGRYEVKSDGGRFIVQAGSSSSSRVVQDARLVAFTLQHCGDEFATIARVGRR